MYRKLKQLIAGIAVIVCITGCGEKNEAQKMLDEAKYLFENQQFLEAKNLIDSINIRFAREVAVRKQTLTLMRMVERGESERNIIYCDSLLPIRLKEAEDLKKGFVFEKDTVYDVIGKYIWKTMTVERNTERSYIRCGVDEEGEMYIASVYFGSSPINHTGLTVNVNDGTYAKTPSIPYDGGVNYRFKDMGNTTEVVTYKGDNCKDIVSFMMVVDPKERIKATYTGGKNYVLYLTEADKKAIQATYELAQVLSDITMMVKQKTKAEKKIILIDQKLN